MARIRTIKPEMWTDPAFVECSSNARLLFVAALNFASDYGVIEDSATRLKMQCFPGDNIDVTPLVDELVTHRLWLRMTAPDGANVLVIRTFCDHQRVDRAQDGRWGDWHKWPLKRVDSTNDRRTIDERSGCNGREGSKDLRADALDADFQAFYAAWPKKKSKLAAQAAYVKARQKATADQILAAITPVAKEYADPARRQFVPYPATWLRAGGWLDETESPAARKRPDWAFEV